MQNLSMDEMNDVVLQFADRCQTGGEKNSALIFRGVEQKHRQLLLLGEIFFLTGQVRMSAFDIRNELRSTSICTTRRESRCIISTSFRSLARASNNTESTIPRRRFV